jgi:hypothetical protein
MHGTDLFNTAVGMMCECFAVISPNDTDVSFKYSPDHNPVLEAPSLRDPRGRAFDQIKVSL